MAAPAPERALLRFIACGSVDDGKSTLLGRLLHDAEAIPEDQRAQVARDSQRQAPGAPTPDFALLLDGLEAEREQGITIDVAYRYFSTARRSFIVADTPGHDLYTRNMVTGASTADLAVLLVDARHGVRRQTRRHSRIVQALGIAQVVLAVNKMDLTDFDAARFAQIVADYQALARAIGVADVTAIPVAARDGDNLVSRSARMLWYRGPTLIEALEAARPEAAAASAPFTMPVQLVIRGEDDLRGYAGRVASGCVRPGDTVRLLPSGQAATVARLIASAGDPDAAGAGQSVLLSFTEPTDCARGEVLAAPGATARAAQAVSATLIWLHATPLAAGRRYLLKLGTRTVGAVVSGVEQRFDPDRGTHMAAATLTMNDIGRARLAFDRAIALDLYARSRTLGGFILIDPASNATVAAGLVETILTDTRPLTPVIMAADATEAVRIAGELGAQGEAAVALTEAGLAPIAAAASHAARAMALAELLQAAGVRVVISPEEGKAPGHD